MEHLKQFDIDCHHVKGSDNAFADTVALKLKGLIKYASTVMVEQRKVSLMEFNRVKGGAL